MSPVLIREAVAYLYYGNGPGRFSQQGPNVLIINAFARHEMSIATGTKYPFQFTRSDPNIATNADNFDLICAHQTLDAAQGNLPFVCNLLEGEEVFILRHCHTPDDWLLMSYWLWR